MPLTPRFELSQTEIHVIVTIFVPTVRVTNIEVILEESDSTFHFHASPYLLKLHFAPHKFAEDGNVSAQYDPSSQTIQVPLKKFHQGVQWPNLDLTARLLQPKEIPKQWLHSVEAISENEKHSTNETADNSSCHITPCDGYGFGGIFQNIFTDYCRAGIAQEMLQLKEPEFTSSTNRRSQRIHKEDEDFNQERYIQDLYIHEDYLYPMVMQFQAFWSDVNPSAAKDSIERDLTAQFQEINLASSNQKKEFTSDERLQLASIPYPLIPNQLLDTRVDSTLWPGLLDLLAPFVYDHLTTLGDPTVESAWTITTLSSSLSWLDPPTTISEAVNSSSRRMLIYPYWRNHDFNLHVWDCTLSLLKTGVHAVVKCLLRIREILEKSESYYVGNKLFVDPFLYWIQQLDGVEIPTKVVAALEEELRMPDQLKKAMGLQLVAIEQCHVTTETDHDSSIAGAEDVDDDDSSDSDTSSDDESEHDSMAPIEEGTQQECRDLDKNILSEKAEQPQLLDSVVGNSTSILQIVAGEEKGVSGSPKNLSVRKNGPLIVEYD